MLKLWGKVFSCTYKWSIYILHLSNLSLLHLIQVDDMLSCWNSVEKLKEKYSKSKDYLIAEVAVIGNKVQIGYDFITTNTNLMKFGLQSLKYLILIWNYTKFKLCNWKIDIAIAYLTSKLSKSQHILINPLWIKVELLLNKYNKLIFPYIFSMNFQFYDLK